MANRIQQFTEKTTVVDTDTVLIQETSDGSYKYATVLNVVADILAGGGITTDFATTGVITGATVEATGDTSAGDNAAIGYTATEGLILTGQGSTNDVTIKNDADGTVLEIATGTTNVELTSGNLIIGTSGKGIDFSETSNSAGMASELFDDYEEGTWTPVVSDGTNNATMGAGNEGYYTKIGDRVFLSAYIDMSAIGSVSGTTRITGLPFTAAAKWSAFTVGAAFNLSITAGHVVTAVVNGTSYFEPYVWDATTGATAMQHSEWGSSGDLVLQGVYIV